MKLRTDRKRLIITSGDSRVGKSTISRILLELYLELNLKVRAYYSGERHKLSAYEKLLTVGNLALSQGGADCLLINLEASRDTTVVLTDLPGQCLPQFKRFVEETAFFEAIESVGYRITFLQPMSHRSDCVEYLKDLWEFSGDAADYVIVKNHHFGEAFPYYEKFKSDTQILGDYGIELVLGNLSLSLYESLEGSHKSYGQTVKCNQLYMISRSGIFNWMNKFNNSIRNDLIPRSLLGLAYEPEVDQYQEPELDNEEALEIINF